MDPADIHPIPLRDLRAALVVAALLLVAVYLVTLDQGQLSQAGTLLHDLMHDGRHVLGVPCH